LFLRLVPNHLSCRGHHSVFEKCPSPSVVRTQVFCIKGNFLKVTIRLDASGFFGFGSLLKDGLLDTTSLGKSDFGLLSVSDDENVA